MKRLAFLWFHFAAVVAGSGWEETDELSLLQLTNSASRHSKQRRHEDVHQRDAVHSVHSLHPAANLAMMTAFMSDMERQHGNSSGSWGDSEKTALETLKIALDEQFTPFLDAEESSDMQEFNDLKKVHQLCVSHHAVDDDSVAAIKSGLDEKALKHRGCRKSQKSWNAYRALAILTSSCATDSDLTVMHEVYGNHVDLASSMNTAKSDAQDYNDLAVDGVTGKHDCIADQTAYENHWCAWSKAKDVSCTLLSRCLGAVGLNGVITAIETRAANRRMLWDTVRQLLCRIEHLLSTLPGTDNEEEGDQESAEEGSVSEGDQESAEEGSVSEGDQEADEEGSVSETSAGSSLSDFSTDDECDLLEDSTKYVLSLDNPPDVPCAEAFYAADGVIKPTGLSCSAWIAQQYSASWPPTQSSSTGASDWMPPSSHVEPACIADCPESAAPGVVHQGCTEDVAGCRFYNAHPEACGRYDTGSDVPSTDCCACKPACDAITDCSGQGTTTDLDSTNGCECECDAGFEGPDCADASPIPNGGEFLLEFCEGPRTGQQFKVFFPADISMSSHWLRYATTDFDQVAFCSPDRPALEAMIAGRPDDRRKGQLAFGWVGPNRRRNHVTQARMFAETNCDRVLGSGVYLNIGQCGSGFLTQVQYQIHNNNGEYGQLPSWMTLAGGIGWEIFATISDDEKYKFLSTPIIP